MAWSCRASGRVGEVRSDDRVEGLEHGVARRRSDPPRMRSSARPSRTLNASRQRARAKLGSRRRFGEHAIERCRASSRRTASSTSTKRCVQRRVGPRRDDEFEPRLERVAEAASQSIRIATAGVRWSAGRAANACPELAVAPLEEVLDRREHEVVLRREVVHLRAARHAGPPHDLGGASCRPSPAPPGTRPSRRAAACGSRRCVPRWSFGSVRACQASKAASTDQYKQSSLFVYGWPVGRTALGLSERCR